jgi:hypothetical protein
MSETEREGVPVPVVWVLGDDLLVHTTNQFLGQVVATDEIVLTFGQIVPPVVLGEDADDRRRQLEEISFVPIQAVARFGMNRQRLTELAGVIASTLENHDKMFGGEHE